MGKGKAKGNETFIDTGDKTFGQKVKSYMVNEVRALLQDARWKVGKEGF